MIGHPLVASSTRTCYACPEQYEGKLTDGRWFYFRYRNSWAGLAVGENYDDVMGREDAGMASGDGLQGIFGDHQIRDQVFAELVGRLSALRTEADQPKITPEVAGELAQALRTGSYSACYAKCSSCQFGACPGDVHTWMDSEDIEFAAGIDYPTTPEAWAALAADRPCGCPCMRPASPSEAREGR